MLKERIASQSEVIRAIVSGDSPCCGVPHHEVVGGAVDELEQDVVLGQVPGSLVRLEPCLCMVLWQINSARVAGVHTPQCVGGMLLVQWCYKHVLSCLRCLDQEHQRDVITCNRKRHGHQLSHATVRDMDAPG